MSPSPEALHTIGTVACQLGERREQGVFVGRVVGRQRRSDPAAQGSRATSGRVLLAAGKAAACVVHRVAAQAGRGTLGA